MMRRLLWISTALAAVAYAHEDETLRRVDATEWSRVTVQRPRSFPDAVVRTAIPRECCQQDDGSYVGPPQRVTFVWGDSEEIVVDPRDGSIDRTNSSLAWVVDYGPMPWEAPNRLCHESPCYIAVREVRDTERVLGSKGSKSGMGGSKKSKSGSKSGKGYKSKSSKSYKSKGPKSKSSDCDSSHGKGGKSGKGGSKGHSSKGGSCDEPDEKSSKNGGLPSLPDECEILDCPDQAFVEAWGLPAACSSDEDGSEDMELPCYRNNELVYPRQPDKWGWGYYGNAVEVSFDLFVEAFGNDAVDAAPRAGVVVVDPVTGKYTVDVVDSYAVESLHVYHHAGADEMPIMTPSDFELYSEKCYSGSGKGMSSKGKGGKAGGMSSEGKSGKSGMSGKSGKGYSRQLGMSKSKKSNSSKSRKSKSSKSKKSSKVGSKKSKYSDHDYDDVMSDSPCWISVHAVLISKSLCTTTLSTDCQPAMKEPTPAPTGDIGDTRPTLSPPSMEPPLPVVPTPSTAPIPLTRAKKSKS